MSAIYITQQSTDYQWQTPTIALRVDPVALGLPLRGVMMCRKT